MNDLSVLIPVYRNQQGLDRTLRSLDEASGSFDVVVVDDGSLEPIHAPARLRDDVPVHLLRLEANRGIARALNHGLDQILAQEYLHIARLDAGDSVVRDRFQRQVEVLERRPACAVVGSFIEFVGEDQKPLFCHRAPSAHKKIVRSLHVNNCILHAGSMLRASALKQVGTYREDCPGAEDYEMFLRMSRRYELAVIPEVLTRCEYALDGLSIAGRRTQQRTRLGLQLRYFDPWCPQSYYGVVRTLAAMLAPHKSTLRIKLALGSADVRGKPDPELAP